jgi:superfamily II DNA or RNA helicase
MTTAVDPSSLYDHAVLTRADRVAGQALDDFLSSGVTPRGVVVNAPAGAGKTRFVVAAVAEARIRRLRVPAATPTNDQAFSLVERLATSAPNEVITFVPASHIGLPPQVSQLPNVRELKAAQANNAGVVVGTVSKLGDAFARGDLARFDALFIDESFQADSAQYYGVAGLADLHLLVGDCGHSIASRR